MAKEKTKKIGFIKRMLLNAEGFRHQATLMSLWNCSILYKDELYALAAEDHNFNEAMILAKSRKEKKALKAEHQKKVEAIKDKFRFAPAYEDDRIVQVIDPEEMSKGDRITITDPMTNETKTFAIQTEEEDEKEMFPVYDAIFDEGYWEQSLKEILSSKDMYTQIPETHHLFEDSDYMHLAGGNMPEKADPNGEGK